MALLNPYNPDTLGIEWAPDVEAAQVIDGPVRAGAAVFTAAVTESIDEIALFLPQVTVADAGCEIEVYDTADLGDRNVTTSVFVPGDDVINYQGFAFGAFAPAGTAADIWRGIDSYPAPLFAGKGTWPNSGQPIDNDEIVFPIFGQAYEVGFRYVGVAGTTGTRRITRVTLKARAQMYVFEANRSGLQITPFLMINGAHYWADAQSRSGEAPGGHLIEASWTANPATGCSWKASDLDDFDAATGVQSAAGWAIASSGSANKLAALLQGWIEVEYTTDAVDPRVAVGCLHPDAPGWNLVTLADPVTGAPWAKVAATEYLITLRRRTGSGSTAWRYLGGPTVPPGPHARDVEFTAQSQILAGMSDDDLPRTYAWALLDAGTVSADSSPYASINGDVEANLGISSPWTIVDILHNVAQEYTIPAGADYGWVRALVCLERSTTDDPLTLTLVDPGATPVGTPLVFQAEDLSPSIPKTRWQIVEGSVGPIPLTGLDQYRILATTNATVGQGWRVQILSTYLVGGRTNPPPGIEDATWDGATDCARINGTRREELDAAMTLATQPDPPADFAATDTAVDECRSVVTVSWTATTIVDGGGFDRYEIDRSDDGLTWYRVATIGLETDASWVDHEARRERVNYYRMRVRRVDQSASIWTDTETANPQMPCCGYILTSNVDPTLEVFAVDIGPPRPATPLNSVVYRRFIGRKYQIGFHSLEFLGVSFARRLLLAALGGQGGVEPTATPGQRTFIPILDLMPSRGAALPYLCVISETGDRWFASMEITNLIEEGAGGGYIAEVTFTEVTDVPAPVEIDMP